MTIVPIGNRVLLSRKLQPQQTDSGLYIPDNARDPMQRCDVLAVSEEVSALQIGDVVIIGKYAGAQVDLEGTPCFLVEVDDILARVK